MKKLAVIITHPIQYYVPVFQLLAKACDLKVFYTWGEQCLGAKYDPGFGKVVDWDIPLLEGYPYEFLKNTAVDPGSHHGKGIVNPELIDSLTAFQPDAILVYGYIYKSHFKVMRHFKGKIPIWFRGDSTLLDEQFSLKSVAKKWYLKWVYSYVDRAFYVGLNNKAYFKQFGLKEEQLIFAPHAIDNERFAVDRSDEVVVLRDRLGIHEEDILILFAGKLEPKKNPELLLEAFIELTEEQRTRNKEQGLKSKEQGEKTKEQETRNNEQRAMHLLFVGNGILEESLKFKVKSEKLQNIHFIDFQNQTQMPVMYQACDIFCLPSDGPGETWGLAINEAMAAGKAVIVSDKVGCAVDLVKENGATFKSKDLMALKNILSSLTVAKHKLRRCGEQSLTIINQWSFQKQVDKIIEELEHT